MIEAENNAGVNDGGNQGTDSFPKWMSSLPDAYKSNAVLAQYREGMPYDKIVNLLGAEDSMVRIPGEKATDEEKAEFYSKLGRPQTADGYNINRPADLPDNLNFDQQGVNAFKQFAHENGYTQAQTEKLFNWYCGLLREGVAIDSKNKQEAHVREQQETQRIQTEAVNALRIEWKDNFEGNLSKAVIGFKTFSREIPDAEKMLNFIVRDDKFGNIRLGDHPYFTRLFYNVATSILSDSAISGKGGGSWDIGDKSAKVASQMFPSMNK